MIGLGLGSGLSLTAGVGGVSAPLDPFWTSVKLLMGFDGTNGSTAIVDESPLAQTVTVNGAAQISTTTPKFGTGALRCTVPGTDFVQVPDNAGFAYGNGDFTMECWWMPIVGGNHYIMGQGSAGGFVWNGLMVESGLLQFGNRDFSNPQTAFSPTANQWYLLCVERASTVIRLYIDGVMGVKATVGTTALTDATDPFRVGEFFPGFGTNARIDEVRVTKGVARYNSDGGYAVPTAAYPRS